MDSSIISGLLGGVAAIMIGLFITKSARKKVTNGELRHGFWLLIMAFACLSLAMFAGWAFFYDNGVQEKSSEMVAVLGLFFGFGFTAVACFAEYFTVQGRFNSQKIAFYSLWTGAKEELWQNLVTATFNSWLYGYTLEFKSGAKIRLSAYLLGHGEVLQILKDRGFDF